MAIFTGGAADDILTGGAEDDHIYGNGGNDSLSGGDGRDIISGNDGADILYGEGGDDILYTANRPTNVSYPYNDASTPDTGTEIDTVYGGAGSDRIHAGYGDHVDGGANVDYLFISFLGATTGVMADFRQTTQVIGGGTITGIENISWVQGSNFDDEIIIYSSGGYQDFTRVYGMGGNDRIVADYYTSDLYGGDGDDVLDGRESRYLSRLEGGAGNDIIYTHVDSTAEVLGGDGDDIIYSHGTTDGGAGNDLIIIATPYAADWVQGGAGDDEIRATSVWNGAPMIGGVGADILTGGAGNDIIHSDQAAVGAQTSLDMGLERDTLSGGGGNDTLSAGYGDHIDGGAGSDRLTLSLGGATSGVTLHTADLVSGQPFVLGGGTIQGIEVLSALRGSEYGDTLTISTLANTLTVDGGGGDDVIRSSGSAVRVNGGDGDDRFISGAAADVFDGGAGSDTLDYSAYTTGVTVNMVAGTGAGSDRFTNVENVTGSAFNDTLTGNAGANILRGGAGNDTLDGGDGVDTAVFSGLSSDYFISVSGGVITVMGADGIDTLTNIERLQFADGVFPPLHGTVNGEILTGTGAGDLILAGDGDDTLIGLAGNDLLNGGAGSDTVDYSAAPGAVTARLDIQGASADGYGGSDTFTSIENLTGSAFNDLLIGDANANILVGGAGRDVLLGGDGDDLISGGADAPNELSGGPGNDTYILENRSDWIIEYAGEGYDTVLTAVSQINLAANIENLTYTGTGTFTGVGNAVNNVITGGTGRDVLLGLGGDDALIGGSGAANELYGGAGNDTYVLDVADTIVELVGEGIDTVKLRELHNHTLGSNVENGMVTGHGDFVLNGNALDNVLTGGNGNDTLQGGAGNDTLNGGAGIDTVTYILSTSGVTARLDLGRATNDGLGGTDTFTGFENLTGSNLRDTLMGDAGNNVIDGAIGNDVLLGFDGDDILIGGSGGGVNEMYGGRGNDLYIVDAADTLIELAGEGIDTVQTTMGNFTLKANIEHLTYVGPGNFGGTGNAENNTITGGAGHDTLAGLGGDDLLIGGAGNDLALLQGVRANYSFTQIEGGWRVVDSVTGRDGTDTLLGIESVRFANGEVLVLSSLIPPAPAATPEVMALLSDKTLFDDAFVLPALPEDEPLVLPGLVADKAWADLPQVLPTADDLFAGNVVMDVIAPAHTPLHGHADGFGEAGLRDWMI